MKFAHIADTHIKNLKYHKEYRDVFSQLYKTLKEQKVDYIIHCGDIAHTKTQISPEFVELCSEFLKNLADIAPTYIILGNHDGNLRNSFRQDAITPIVDALDHPNLHLLKKAGETHLNDDFCLNVLSVFDEDNWVKPSNPDKINIGLYHGAIRNSRTDIGFILEHGEHDLSIFEDFDFGFLGDIHKTQSLDHAARVAYAGSTIQQNFGETQDKGIFIWDIQSKDSWTRTKHDFVNPKPFITINLTNSGRIPNGFSCAPGARLRIVASANTPLEKLRRAVDIAKHRFKPESITFLNKANTGDLTASGKVDSEILENLRDEKVQQDLIREYLKEYNPAEETLNEVFALNSKYNKVVEESEDISRNVHWKIKRFEWDNLFNYGEGNSIDFDNLTGTVGIFGKNYSGKSSVIDSLLYTIYNNTSKNIRKTYNIINQNKDWGSGKVEIEANNKIYTITRKSEKYVKKLKGKTTDEAKTQADFDYVDQITGEIGSLNQTERGGTDKAIRNVFGDMDDFLATSMSSQTGALSFINEGSTRRKEILAKFLDLEFFERKFKLAKDDAADLKGALRRIQDIDYDSLIDEVKKDLFTEEADLLKQKNLCTKLKQDLSFVKDEISGLESQLNNVPSEVSSMTHIEDDLDEAKKRKKDLESQVEELSNCLKEKEDFLKKCDSLLETIDIVDLNDKEENYLKIQKEIDDLIKQKSKKDTELFLFEKQTGILNGIPCGNSYLTTCKFIKDANDSTNHIPLVEKVIKEIESKIVEKESKATSLDLDKVRKTIDNFNKLTQKRKEEETGLNLTKVKLDLANSGLSNCLNEIQSLEKTLQDSLNNKELIEKFEKTTSLLKEKKGLASSIELNLQECEEKVYSLVATLGATEQKKKNLEEQKESKVQMNKEFSAYDLFMTCMHSNGIAFDVIKKALPVINEEIARVLSNVVDFEVFFENNENKLDILIKHPKHEPRPLENGSGAEKTLAAIAIRIALLNVSNMPKGDIMILDEPGTALDAESMEGFVRILDLVKGFFDVTLLITHIESLKDIVDMTIEISKTDEGYASINQ